MHVFFRCIALLNLFCTIDCACFKQQSELIKVQLNCNIAEEYTTIHPVAQYPTLELKQENLNKSRRTQRCDLTFAQLLKRLTLEFLNLKHSFENIKGFANLYNLHPSQQKHGDIEDCASKKYFSITSIDHFSQNRLIGIWNFTRCFIICNICFYSIVTLLLHIYSVLQMS